MSQKHPFWKKKKNTRQEKRVIFFIFLFQILFIYFGRCEVNKNLNLDCMCEMKLGWWCSLPWILPFSKFYSSYPTKIIKRQAWIFFLGFWKNGKFLTSFSVKFWTFIWNFLLLRFVIMLDRSCFRTRRIQVKERKN